MKAADLAELPAAVLTKTCQEPAPRFTLITVRLFALLTLTPAAGCWKQVLLLVMQNQTSVPPETKPVPFMVPPKSCPATGVVFHEKLEIVGGDCAG